jgi:spore germination protein KC
MTVKRRLCVLLLLFSMLILSTFSSGCWSSKEVENMAIVTSMGFDLVSENGEDKWQLTQKMLSPVGKKGSEQSPQKGGSEKLLVGKGATQQEAIIESVAHISRWPFWGHLSITVIGERAARQGIQPFADLAARYWETRPRMFVTVARGEALKVLEVEPEVEATLSKEIRTLAEQKVQSTGTSYGVILSDFLAWLTSPDRDAVAAQIKVIPPQEGGKGKSVLIEGLGVFRDDKLVGWLNKEETTGYLLIAQKITKGKTAIPVKVGEKVITYFVGISKSKIEPMVTGDKLSFRVTIKTQGEVAESNGIELSSEDIEKVEKSAGETIRGLAEKTIEKAKEYKSDFLGFTEKLHRSNLEEYQKLGEHWREAFSEADVEVVVDAKIIRSGKIGKKLKIKQE